MSKPDYKKELKQFYSAKAGEPVVIQVPKMNFVMIDGIGDPNTSQDYIDAIQTLYPIAYKIKFISKLQHDKDFSVMPLEGLWWAPDITDFTSGNKNRWHWTAMIMQPDVVTEAMYEEAVRQIKEKSIPPALAKARFASYDEGRAAQVLYMGPYSDEASTIVELHDFIGRQGGTLNENNKHHHEIYLNDPRRADPQKLKTIIRQPF